MNQTSYTIVPIEEVRTACELRLDERNTRIKNKIDKEIENAMFENIYWFSIYNLKWPKKHRTYDEAFEYVHNHIPEWKLFSIAGKIKYAGSGTQDRVERLLHACKAPNDGFIYMSVEDNAILEGYYEQ